MRAVILLLIWLCAARTAEAQAAVASSSPKNVVEAVADPSKAESQVFDLEYLSRSFAFSIDRLSVQLSQTLGPWSNRDLLLQITPAKIILGILSALVALAILQVVRFLLAAVHRRRHNEPSEQRFWVGGILRALRKGVGIFFWVTAIFLFLSPLLPHIAIGLQNEGIFHLVSKLTELGYFAALFVFCYYLVLLIGSWLTLHAQREPRQWYYPAFPFLGKLLFYNFILISLQLCLNLLQLPGSAQALSSKLVSIASAIVNCVTFIQMIRAVEDMLVSRTSLRNHDIYKFRGFLTRLQVLRRLIVFLVIIISIGVILMNIDAVRQVGTGLLASAGVAGVIFGFAAQKSLSTIIAGLQIALTGPMKIDDVVIVEGEYGTIEEITLTYVVVKLWDLRRMILPITYFLDKPFQNWTRTSSELIGAVLLYTDFMIPIEEIRRAGEKIVAASPLWDKRVYAAQVTDWKNETVEIRILVSSDTAPHLFDLRCEVRERILNYLQQRNPEAFPHVRTTFFPADGSSFGDQKPQRSSQEKPVG
jgi:small-conductance mechanosensitive channel